MPWTHVALLAVGYCVGGLSAGYWLVRWRTGGDVREHGSGATGATNVGRVLGPSGFAITLAADAAKGAAVAGVSRALEAPLAWSAACALAVVAGHVWPAQLGFRGGKGVAPLIGAWLVLEPLVLAAPLAAGVLVLAVTRRFVVSGLCGLTLLPAGQWWCSRDSLSTAVTAATVGVVLFAHREMWISSSGNS